ncbi:MAG: hypothetical protein HYU25_16180 [Candidatus Rokubacteria bacterium]|nr:hypothetical protein [Candidatus Rokubacteria bacterium]
MLRQYKRKINIAVGAGVLVQIVGIVLTGSRSVDPDAQPLFNLIGASLILYGCVMYARAKGYSGWLGLLGLGWLLGLIVLAMLPDRHKQA